MEQLYPSCYGYKCLHVNKKKIVENQVMHSLFRPKVEF